MKTYKILLVPFLLLFACSPKEGNLEKLDVNKKSVLKLKEKVKIVASPKKQVFENLDSLIENFLHQVRDSPYEKMTYSPLLKKEVNYLALFPKKGLSEVTLYTNPKVKKSKKIKYTDLYLTSLKYETDSFAIESFKDIKEKIKVIISPAARGSFDDGKKYITLRGVDPYTGSFIIQKNNFIYSLRKTCGRNNLLLSFKDYENLFIDILKLKNTNIEIIKSNCGDAKFSVEKIAT